MYRACCVCKVSLETNQNSLTILGWLVSRTSQINQHSLFEVRGVIVCRTLAIHSVPLFRLFSFSRLHQYNLITRNREIDSISMYYPRVLAVPESRGFHDFGESLHLFKGPIMAPLQLGHPKQSTEAMCPLPTCNMLGINRWSYLRLRGASRIGWWALGFGRDGMKTVRFQILGQLSDGFRYPLVMTNVAIENDHE